MRHLSFTIRFALIIVFCNPWTGFTASALYYGDPIEAAAKKKRERAVLPNYDMKLDSLEKWIKELGSDNWKIRENATNSIINSLQNSWRKGEDIREQYALLSEKLDNAQTSDEVKSRIAYIQAQLRNSLIGESETFWQFSNKALKSIDELAEFGMLSEQLEAFKAIKKNLESHAKSGRIEQFHGELSKLSDPKFGFSIPSVNNLLNDFETYRNTQENNFSEKLQNGEFKPQRHEPAPEPEPTDDYYFLLPPPPFSISAQAGLYSMDKAFSESVALKGYQTLFNGIDCIDLCPLTPTTFKKYRSFTYGLALGYRVGSKVSILTRFTRSSGELNTKVPLVNAFIFPPEPTGLTMDLNSSIKMNSLEIGTQYSTALTQMYKIELIIGADLRYTHTTATWSATSFDNPTLNKNPSMSGNQFGGLIHTGLAFPLTRKLDVTARVSGLVTGLPFKHSSKKLSTAWWPEVGVSLFLSSKKRKVNIPPSTFNDPGDDEDKEEQNPEEIALFELLNEITNIFLGAVEDNAQNKEFKNTILILEAIGTAQNIRDMQKFKQGDAIRLMRSMITLLYESNSQNDFEVNSLNFLENLKEIGVDLTSPLSPSISAKELGNLLYNQYRKKDKEERQKSKDASRELKKRLNELNRN